MARVRFRSAEGLYLSAENGGGREILANSAPPGDWETFALTDVNGGELLITGEDVYLSCFRGQYLTAVGGGGSQLIAVSAEPSVWERFTLRKVEGTGPIKNGDVVRIQCSSGQYVQASPNGRVHCGGNSVPKFFIEFIEESTMPSQTPRVTSPSTATDSSGGLSAPVVGSVERSPGLGSSSPADNSGGGRSAAVFDRVQQTPELDGTPPDLLPRSGEYPTDRVFFSTLVLDAMDDSSKLQSLEQHGQLDLYAALTNAEGFQRPATGALLTYAQSWYTRGLSLGHLLHSIALAPGESTRIAIVDWARRERGSQQEDIAEQDSLQNSLTHKRAIGEVTEVVAQEAQEGFSRVSAKSRSEQEGGSLGGALGGMVNGVTFGLAGGYSHGSAKTSSTAASFSCSSGQSNLAASMAQNVLDATHQAANSTRNRRAAVVREISQTEKETLTTRVITNYNHMHALSINYYEIVQLYRVAVELSAVERCLFVPIKLLDVDNPAVLDRFQDVIVRNALRQEVALLRSSSSVVVTVPLGGAKPWGTSEGAGIARVREVTGWNYMTPDETSLLLPRADVARIGTRLPSLNLSYMVQGETESVAQPQEHPFEGLFIETLGGEQFCLKRSRFVEGLAGQGGVYGHDWVCTLPSGLSGPGEYSKIRRVWLKKAPHAKAFAGTVRVLFYLALRDENALKAFGVSAIWAISPRATIPVSEDAQEVEVFRFESTGDVTDLMQHLRDNRTHYSQCIWKSLDPATLALALSSYSYNGKPLLQVISPTPVTLAGNYMVFRMHADPEKDEQWRTWLAEHGVTVVDGDIEKSVLREDIVPLPSGGVFAEAVLGRSNCAEKLDITRFWNWQDSPIPIQAPEITPLQSGSRATQGDYTPGQLSQPLINIVSPSSLPDPQGLGAAVSAVTSGNMFRDMSGLSSLMTMAGGLGSSTTQSATAAAAQAGANMAAAVQLASIAAAQSLSARGAGINEVKKERERRSEVPSAGTNATQYSGATDESPEVTFPEPTLFNDPVADTIAKAALPGSSHAGRQVGIPKTTKEFVSVTTGPVTIVGRTTDIEIKLRIYTPSPLVDLLEGTTAIEQFAAIGGFSPATNLIPGQIAKLGKKALRKALQSLGYYPFARGNARSSSFDQGHSYAEMLVSCKINKETLEIAESDWSPENKPQELTEWVVPNPDQVCQRADVPWWYDTTQVLPSERAFTQPSSVVEQVAVCEPNRPESKSKTISLHYKGKPFLDPQVLLDGILRVLNATKAEPVTSVVDAMSTLLVPVINWECNIVVTKDSSGELQYRLDGKHDGFPSFELYVNKRSPVYLHEVEKTEFTPAAICDARAAVAFNLPDRPL